MTEENESIEIQTDALKWLLCPGCDGKIVVAMYPPFSTIECPTCNKRLTVPAKLGNYMLLKELGRGNMGAVYQAYDETLERDVAIKVMRRSLGADEAFVKQFLREARALAALNHPNVVQIYTCGKEKGQPYIVMEFVSGSKFDSHIGAGKKLDETMVLKTGIDVARGLSAASNIGLTHGDVKPENIIFNKKKLAKVADFGLARFSGEDLSQGQTWGTPFYIAPEAAQGNPPDQRSDIYSLGATLYHAIAGEPPFQGQTVQETILARFKETARPLQALRPDLHPETAAIIARMLERDPFLRYPNYNSLLADMNQALDVSKRISSSKSKPKKKKSSAPLIVSMVFLVLAVVAGAVLWHSSAAQKKKKPPVKRASGPRKMILVNGKLVPAPNQGSSTSSSKPKASGTTTAPPVDRNKRVSLTTESGAGADGYVQGVGGSVRDRDSGFGQSDVLWVKAGRNTGLHLVRKAYMKFDFGKLAGSQVSEATLTMMVAPSGKNGTAGNYKLKLWGIRKDALWSDSGRLADGPMLTWRSAPGNALQSAIGMGQEAELLAEIVVEANPPVGHPIKFTDADSVRAHTMARYLASRIGKTATLVVTADDQSTQRGGWKFASKEHAYLDGPALVMKGPYPAR